MLSFIEMSQFQNYLIENDNEQRISPDVIAKIRLGNDMEFAKNIPISEIVEREFKCKNDGQMSKLKMKVYQIYKKYIEVGSEFEINISSLQRSELKYIANLSSFLQLNINMDDLVMVFQDCKETMRLLLMYSLARFKSTKEFEEIEQIFDKNVQEIVIHERDIL